MFVDEMKKHIQIKINCPDFELYEKLKQYEKIFK